MSLELSALRQAWATRVAAISSAWWEAPVPADAFGTSGVPDGVPAQKAHLAFAIDIGDAEPGERQRVSEGTDTVTVVGVVFLARHTPGPTNSQASYDAAIDARSALVKQIMATGPTWPVTHQVQRLLTLPRPVVIATGEHFLLRAAFEVRHRLPLS